MCVSGRFVVVVVSTSAAMPGPRSELKDTAPKVHVIAIAEDKRPAILANGAANLKAVEAATGARLALDDRRSVLNVWAPSPAAFKEVEVRWWLCVLVTIFGPQHALPMADVVVCAFVG